MKTSLTIPGKKPPYLMAHRGNNVLCPENTIPAFHQAIKDGADILETDIHVSKDGHIVCIHDTTVNRTTNGSGFIEDLTLDEIKQLNASAKHTRWLEPTQIPILSELLAIVPDDVVVALEIKTDQFTTEKNFSVLVDQLNRYSLHERTLILSFKMKHLLAVRKFSPLLKIGLISMTRLFPCREVDVVGTFYPMAYINPLMAKLCHRNGQLFCPLDPQPDQRLSYYKKIGCDAIISDNSMATRTAMNKIWNNH